MSSKNFLPTVFVLFAANYLFAQKDSLTTKALDEVTVTANKFETKTLQTGKVITIITQQQLARAGGKDLSQILHEQAGLYLNGSGSNIGKDKTIFLRGAKGEHTLITIDGVPVYDPSGVTSSFDIRSIPVENIDRIEILKGSQSTLYGSDAIAGVINIILKKGTKKIAPSLMLNYGSFNTLRANAAVNGRYGKFDYHAAYTFYNTDGISEATDKQGTGNFDKDGSRQNSFMTGVGVAVSKNIRINPYILVNNFKGDLDNSSFTDDKDYSQELKNFQAGIRNEFNLEKLKVRLLYNYNYVTRNYFNDTLIKETPFDGYLKGFYKGGEHFLDAYLNLPISSSITFIGGIDYRRSSTSIETSGTYKYQLGGITYSGSYKTALGKDSANQQQTAFYGAFTYRGKGGLNAELGGRLNRHSSYGNNFVFNFNPSYVISKQLKLFANISSAYKVPTLYQLYSEYRNTLSDLQPEKGITYEGGIHYFTRENIFNIRVAIFKRNVQDGIAFYTNPVNFNSYYINQDKQKDYGFEIEPAINIDNKLQLLLSFSYVDGKITTVNGTKDTSYFNLIRRPKRIASSTINFQVTNQLFLSGSVRNYGPRTDLDYGSFSSKTIKLEGYTLLDVYGEYKFGRRFKLFVNGRNLTNVTYYEAAGYNTLERNFNTGFLLTF